MKNEKLFEMYFLPDLCRKLENRFGQSVFHAPTNPTVESRHGMDTTLFLNTLAVRRDGTPKTLRREDAVIGAVQVKDCRVASDYLEWALETKGPANQWDRLLPRSDSGRTDIAFHVYRDGSLVRKMAARFRTAPRLSYLRPWK